MSKNDLDCIEIFAFLFLFAISLITCLLIGFDSTIVLVIFSILLLVMGAVYVIRHFNG